MCLNWNWQFIDRKFLFLAMFYQMCKFSCWHSLQTVSYQHYFCCWRKQLAQYVPAQILQQGKPKRKVGLCLHCVCAYIHNDVVLYLDVCGFGIIWLREDFPPLPVPWNQPYLSVLVYVLRKEHGPVGEETYSEPT